MNWTGGPGTSEHRSTGARAWCHECQMWCYPDNYCTCCYNTSETHTLCPTCLGEGYVPLEQDGTIPSEKGTT